jgi:hypothetical protein
MQIRDLVIKRQREQDKKQNIRGRYRAVLTDAEGNQTSTDPQTDVWANQTTRRVWHMPLGATQPSQVFCLNISNPYVGLPVECGYEESNNTVEVLRVDQLPAKYGESPIGWDQNDPVSFEPGGLKMMWLYAKALVPLATWPDDTGLVVNINAGDYPYLGSRKTFTGQTGYTLAAPAGAGTHYYAGLYLDAANLLQVVYGTAVATSSTPPEPAWPAGAFRLSVVRIANGQTSIVFGSDNSADNDVFDRRMLWSDEIAGSAGWPLVHVLTVSTTDTDADYTTIPDAITAASDGDVILVDAETISISTTITVDKALTITSLGGTVITSSVAGPTFELTDAAGATLENLIIRNTGAGAKSGCVKWAVDNVIIRDCLLEKLSGASTVSYCLWQLGGSGHLIDTNAECTDPPGTNYAYLNDTADAVVTITRGQFAGLTADVFTARAGSAINGEFFSANDVSWAGTSNGWYFDSGALVPLAGTPNPVEEISIDGTLAANSDVVLSSQKAIKTYIDSRPLVSPNPFINGALQFWQRGTSFAAVANLTRVADGFKYAKVGTMVHTISESTDVPTIAEIGVKLGSSMLIDCTTADASIAAGDLCIISRAIEGYNFLNLANGFTISFWVKATKTGIHCISFANTGGDRAYVAEYTINTTATWERKTVTVPATPTAGTWDYVNGVGLWVTWALAAGSTFQTTAGAWQTGVFYATANQVNACDDAANDFRITGIRIEPGAVATPFVLPDYQQEYARILRYAYLLDAGSDAADQGFGTRVGTTPIAINFQYPVPMRAAPTLSHNITGYTAGTPGTTTIAIVNYNTGNFYTITGALTVTQTSPNKIYTAISFVAGTSWSGTTGDIATLRVGPDVKVIFSAEF